MDEPFVLSGPHHEPGQAPEAALSDEAAWVPPCLPAFPRQHFLIDTRRITRALPRAPSPTAKPPPVYRTRSPWFWPLSRLPFGRTIEATVNGITFPDSGKHRS